MFICNNYRFRGDSGRVGSVENYVKNILKKFESSEKNSAENMDHRQIFICNDRKCILILSKVFVDNYKNYKNF